MKLRTLDKSILKELLLAFGLGLISLNVIMATDRVIRLTKDVAAVGISAWDIAKVVFYLQPMLMILTTPLGMFVAVLLVYGRLQTDNELTVLKACGEPFSGIARPAFILGLLCFALSLWASVAAGPAGARAIRHTMTSAVTKNTPNAIEEGVFHSSHKDFVIHVKSKDKDGVLGGVFVYDGRKQGFPVILHARTGKLSSALKGTAIRMDLSDGKMYFIQGARTTEVGFQSYELVVPLSFKQPEKEKDELGPMGLWRQSQAALGLWKVALEVELNRRFALPMLCLIFTILGPPLAMRGGKTGRLSGLVLGLGAFGLYYALAIFFERHALTGKIPSWAGVWPPVIILTLCAWAVFKAEGRR